MSRKISFRDDIKGAMFFKHFLFVFGNIQVQGEGKKGYANVLWISQLPMSHAKFMYI